MGQPQDSHESEEQASGVAVSETRGLNKGSSNVKGSSVSSGANHSTGASSGSSTTSSRSWSSNGGLDRIRDQLQAELDIAEEEVGRLAAEHAAALGDLEKIKAALSALGRPGRGAKKPAFKKAEVVKLITSLLRQAEAMSEKEITAAVREQVEKSGRPATGISQRIKEALNEPSFTKDGGKYRLS